jgi:hypothetical protein
MAANVDCREVHFYCGSALLILRSLIRFINSLTIVLFMEQHSIAKGRIGYIQNFGAWPHLLGKHLLN